MCDWFVVCWFILFDGDHHPSFTDRALRISLLMAVIFFPRNTPISILPYVRENHVIRVLLRSSALLIPCDARDAMICSLVVPRIDFHGATISHSSLSASCLSSVRFIEDTLLSKNTLRSYLPKVISNHLVPFSLSVSSSIIPCLAKVSNISSRVVPSLVFSFGIHLMPL